MRTVTSKDGTSIAFDQSGQGPALILVGGAFEQRALDTETAKLAALPFLSEHFMVIHYDRRGRGDSTDTLPFAVEREIEDIDALMSEVGGSAFLFGISSGAALAFEAALQLGTKVRKLALYEPPYNDDPEARRAWRDYRTHLDAALAAGRRDEAVVLLMKLIGLPEEHVPMMREMPMWPMFEAVAPTLAYEAVELGEEASVPTEKAARLTVPTLVMDGSESYPFMHVSAVALAQALPHGQQRTLQGQTHEVAADVLAPVLIEFFSSN